MLRPVAVSIALALLLAACGDPAEPTPTATSSLPQATPTPRFAPSVATIEPSLPPTPTWTPPNPDSITPHPTSVPVTEVPRPRIPTADDIKVGDNGKYYAEVDGCRWDEFRRGPQAGTGVEEVGLTTPCLDYEAIIFTPSTGEVDHLIS